MTYAIAYAIKRKENLRFGQITKGKIYATIDLFSTGYFIKEIENISEFSFS